MMPRVVKRYSNRKLYDSATSRYVSLEDVAGFIRAGEEVQVIDNSSGDDLTSVTLAQIILEDERQKRSFVSLPLLRDLVRGSGDAIVDVTRQATDAIDEFRAKAEERVQELVSEGASRRDAFLDTIERSRASLDDLQKRIDDGVKESFDRFRDVTGIDSELERLEAAMKEIEARIRAMLSQSSPPQPEPASDPDSPGEVEPDSAPEPPRAEAGKKPSHG
jgi:polyhydroxyalkanoate synthesis repressor PhaR